MRSNGDLWIYRYNYNGADEEVENGEDRPNILFFNTFMTYPSYKYEEFIIPGVYTNKLNQDSRAFIRIFTSHIDTITDKLLELYKDRKQKRQKKKEKGIPETKYKTIRRRNYHFLYLFCKDLKIAFERWPFIDRFKDTPIGNGTVVPNFLKGAQWARDFDHPYGYKYAVITLLVAITILVIKACIFQDRDYAIELEQEIHSIVMALEYDFVFGSLGIEFEHIRMQTKEYYNEGEKDKSKKVYKQGTNIYAALSKVRRFIKWEYDLIRL